MNTEPNQPRNTTAAPQPAMASPVPQPVTEPAPVTREAPPQSAPPVPPMPKKPTLGFKDPKIIIAVVLGIGILLFGFLYVRSTMQPAEAPVAEVTPTINPTPTPALNLSGIASTSAFLKYSEDVSSFSSILNTFNLQDATLAPPILDIEIDLSE